MKFEIVKIVSDKNDFSKENAVLKNYQNAFVTLTEQNEMLKKKFKELAIMDSVHSLEGNIDVEKNSENEPARVIPDIDRSSPDGQEKESDQAVICKGNSEYEDEVFQLRGKLAESEKEKTLTNEKLESEKKDYVDRNK